jgi:hypothetical protein
MAQEMMDNNLIIRQATKKDLPQIHNFLKALYGWIRPESFMRWQCFETILPVILMCGFHEDELIGMFGIQKRILSNHIVCGQASWLNVAPSYQQQGLFYKLGKAALSHFHDLDVLIVFANSTGRIPCEKAFGLKTIGILKMMVLNSWAKIRKPAGSFIALEIDENSQFSKISEETSEFISFNQSQDYRIWRYALNPMYTYHHILLATGEYAIVKLFVDPLTKSCSGDIVDFECSLKDYDRLLALLETACWFLKEQKADRVTTWAKEGTVCREIVETLGFAGSPYETYFGFKSLRPQCDFLYDFSKWHLRQADATNY